MSIMVAQLQNCHHSTQKLVFDRPISEFGQCKKTIILTNNLKTKQYKKHMIDIMCFFDDGNGQKKHNLHQIVSQSGYGLFYHFFCFTNKSFWQSDALFSSMIRADIQV